jgi:hypothetical protein
MIDALTMPDVSAPETRDPGAPVPKDEVDPELVSLRPRTQVGLLTAFSVLAFCIFLAIKLLPDLGYGGEDQARAVTVEQIVAGKVDDESHVTVPITLERAAAIRIRQSKGVPGLRIAPVAGGGDALWVVIDGEAWSPAREGATYTGRLRHLSDLPFDGPVRSYVRANPAPRHVTADELRRSAKAAELTAVTGDRFAIADDDTIEIVVPDPDAVLVVASFDSFRPDAAAYAKALADAGFIAPGAQPTKVAGNQAWFAVTRPDALASTDAALAAAHLFGTKVEPLIRRHRVAWKDLVVGANGVTADGTQIPWASFEVAAVHVARPLPSDPWVLLVGETPGHYWYVLPLYVLLALFTALFAWALVRTARRELFSPKVPTRA